MDKQPMSCGLKINVLVSTMALVAITSISQVSKADSFLSCGEWMGPGEIALLEARFAKKYNLKPRGSVSEAEGSLSVGTPANLPAVTLPGLRTSKSGLEQNEAHQNLVLGAMAQILEQIPPEAQRAYMDLFGENGIFLNSDFYFQMIDGISFDLKLELRAIKLGQDEVSQELLQAMINEIVDFVVKFYQVNGLSEITKYYENRGIKTEKAAARRRKFSRFFETLPSKPGSEEKFYYRELLAQAVALSILNMDLLNKKGLSTAEYEVAYHAKQGASLHVNKSHIEDGAYGWPAIKAVIEIGIIGAGEVILPGSSLLTVPMVAGQETFANKTALKTLVLRPINIAKRRRHLRRVAESIEERLASGSFTQIESGAALPVVAPNTQLSAEGPSRGLVIGEGAKNGVYDPAQFMVPDEYNFNEAEFVSELSKVEDDSVALERLIEMTLDGFSMKMSLALSNTEIEDRDFFELWSRLESFSNTTQYQEHFKKMETRRSAYEVMRARSEFLWSQREVFVSVLKDMEQFRALIEANSGLSDKSLVLELIDERRSIVEGLKSEFEKNSREMLKIGRGILNESFDEPQSLVEESPDRGARIRLLPKHHSWSRGQSTDVVVAGQGDVVLAEVIMESKSLSYRSFTQGTDVPQGAGGATEHYLEPRIDGLPIVIDGLDGQAINAMCKKLLKATNLGGGSRGYLRSETHGSFSGEVAFVTGKKRWFGKFEYIVRSVENSDRVVSTLVCY